MRHDRTLNAAQSIHRPQRKRIPWGAVCLSLGLTLLAMLVFAVHPTEAGQLPAALLLVGLYQDGRRRGKRHPCSDDAYLRWLMSTPYTPDLPLPRGPVALGMQDLVVPIIPALASLCCPQAAWWAPAWPLVAWMIGYLIPVLRCCLWVSWVASAVFWIALPWGMVLRISATAALVMVAIVYTLVRRSLADSLRFLRLTMSPPRLIGSIGSPWMDLERQDRVWPIYPFAKFIGAAGWIYLGLSAIAESEAALCYVLLALTGGTGVVLWRGKATKHIVAPLSWGGRFALWRWVIPRWDRLAVGPLFLVGLIVGLLVLCARGTLTLPAAGALITAMGGGLYLVTSRCYADWQLTGEFRFKGPMEPRSTGLDLPGEASSKKGAGPSRSRQWIARLFRRTEGVRLVVDLIWILIGLLLILNAFASSGRLSNADNARLTVMLLFAGFWFVVREASRAELLRNSYYLGWLQEKAWGKGQALPWVWLLPTRRDVTIWLVMTMLVAAALWMGNGLAWALGGVAVIVIGIHVFIVFKAADVCSMMRIRLHHLLICSFPALAVSLWPHWILSVLCLLVTVGLAYHALWFIPRAVKADLCEAEPPQFVELDGYLQNNLRLSPKFNQARHQKNFGVAVILLWVNGLARWASPEIRVELMMFPIVAFLLRSLIVLMFYGAPHDYLRACLGYQRAYLKLGGRVAFHLLVASGLLCGLVFGIGWSVFLAAAVVWIVLEYLHCHGLPHPRKWWLTAPIQLK